MAKKIAETLVEDFIRESITLERQTLKVAALKAKLRKADSLGAEHPMLRFEDNVSWRPPWKKLVDELTSAHMTAGQKALYFSRLKRRFKKTNGAKTISILAPRYLAFQETIASLKQKLAKKETV